MLGKADHLDTIVVGAGAAGIAAARRLQSCGFRTVVFEAKDRIGGRVRTDHDSFDIPFDLGAEFVHGDQAVIHHLTAETGSHAIPVDRFGKMWWARVGQKARFWGEHEDAPVIRSLYKHKHTLPSTLTTDGLDQPLSTFLITCGRSKEDVAAADVLLAQTCCAPASDLSCADLANEMRVDTAGDGESRLNTGYGPFLSSLAAGLDIQLGKPVCSIVQLDDGALRVEVLGGEYITARTCIITVPLAALQRGCIHFSPPLPLHKQKAIHSMKMEPATKLLYHFVRPLWDPELTYMCHTGLTARWWTPGYGRPHSDALICCYITADRARLVDDMMDEEAAAVGLKELAVLLGMSLESVQRELIKARVVRWSQEEYVWGGYAYCPAGTAGCREALAAPEWGGCLMFGGEATAYHSNPQTVHGAIESGWRAAREALKRLTASNTPSSKL